MRSKVISVIADVFAGLAAMVLFALGDAYLHVGADFRVAVVVLAALYLCAGFIRGQRYPENAWVKGVSVSSGSFLVLLILGWDSMHHAVLAMLLMVALLFPVCGAHARHLWAARLLAKGAVAASVPWAVLLIAALTMLPPFMTRIATRMTSVTIPEFTISKLDGTTVKSSDFRGRVVLVDLWATWCPACRRELPELDKLYRRYHANPKIMFWAVDVQKNGETPEKVRDFMQKYGYTLPVGVADEEALKALRDLHLEGYPSLIIIDPAGHVRLVHTGYDGSEQLRAELSREIDFLLAERL